MATAIVVVLTFHLNQFYMRATTTSSPDYSRAQLNLLVILRMVIGWHILYEGVVKLWNPNWSAAGYLMDSKGIFAGLFHALAANATVLQIVDFINVWGLILVGLGLMLGPGNSLGNHWWNCANRYVLSFSSSIDWRKIRLTK